MKPFRNKCLTLNKLYLNMQYLTQEEGYQTRSKLNTLSIVALVMSKACNPCVLQDSAQEGVITRDIHRTFPAHDYFKDSDGDGQDSLYKICKVSPRLWRSIHVATELAVSNTRTFWIWSSQHWITQNCLSPHFLYGGMEQKANLNAHCFMLCSNVFENLLWDEKLILKCVQNLVNFVPCSHPIGVFFLLSVIWQGSVGICLAFQVGSKIYNWQCPPLLRHEPFLLKTHRTYAPLSGQSLIFSSNFLSGKT